MDTPDGTVKRGLVKDRVNALATRTSGTPKFPAALGKGPPSGATSKAFVKADDKKGHKKSVNRPAIFEAPAPLIFTDEKTDKLRCSEDTIKQLSGITQPLNVVAITGLFRTGKSYLLNRLAGKNDGFATANNVHACTKGIWIWCREHPTQEDHVLVLLDVEGFGDIEKTNRKEDTWLFTLATLLSSTLIYNNRGAIDAPALERLLFLEEIDSTIEVSKESEDKKLLDFDFFFPNLVFTLRDLGLVLENKQKQKLTADQYMESTLVQKRGKGKDVEMYNKIRLLIRRYFKTRKCFVFITPCGSKLQNKLSTLSENDIESDFLQSVHELCDYIYSMKPLQLKSGRHINGRMFGSLALHYVITISEGKQPSLIEATKQMASAENQVVVSTASEIYKKEMQRCLGNLGDINPKDDALVHFHETCMAAALDYFKKAIVFDDDAICQKKALIAFKRLLATFKKRCDEQSINTCQELLGKLNQRIERKLKNRAYECEGGYDEYIQDINWIVKRFTGTTGLGSKSKAMLQSFLDNKEEEEKTVYQMVINLQQGGQSMETSMPRPSKRDDLASSINRSDSFRHSLKVKVDKLESDVRYDLEEQQTGGLKTIQDNYIQNLQQKIAELERQKDEDRDNLIVIKQLDSEIAFLQKLIAYSSSMTEAEPNSDGENDAEEENNTSPQSPGERPETIGGSVDNSYREERREPEKRRKWCRLQ